MNILIIDDEKNICLTLSEILEDEGHHVEFVHSAEDGIKHISKENFHLIFLDVKLPGMHGVEALEIIKKENPMTEVIMISGHSGISTAVQAVKVGAYDFLEKPLSMMKIQTLVKNIQDRFRHKRKSINRKEYNNNKYKMVGESEKIQKLREVIGRVSKTDAKVLIRGESGTGKELVAYAIHHNSLRRDEPFVIFNSAAIPDELVESELFGYEKGAFTGAEKRKLGKIELAHHGTLFLDEIGDMNFAAQAKILRVIQEGKFERVGGTKIIDIDVRILAATHKNLEEMIKEAKFREDLYYRLNVIPVIVPPLRDRGEDVLILVDYYSGFFSLELKMELKDFSQDARALLVEYPFNGNIRELRNLIERIYILVDGNTVTRNHLLPFLNIPKEMPKGELPFESGENFSHAKKEFEKYYISRELEKCDWSVSKTAKNLGLQQSNLSRKLKELGLQKKR